MVVTRMHGRFRSFSGEFHIGEIPSESSVEVTIDAASLDTTNDAADDSLKSDRFLDVEKYPQLHFRSTKVDHVEGVRWQVQGDLTIKGVTRPITLDATFEGAVAPPRGVRAKLAFVATGEFDRRDYGIDFNIPSRPADGLWATGFAWRLMSKPTCLSAGGSGTFSPPDGLRRHGQGPLTLPASGVTKVGKSDRHNRYDGYRRLLS